MRGTLMVLATPISLILANQLRSFLTVDGRTFVSLPVSFKGRFERGTTIPATWTEFQLDASNDHAAHGDISLEQGCDGAARSAQAMEAKGAMASPREFGDMHLRQPFFRSQTKKVLASTMGNWMGGPSKAATEYETKVMG